MASLGHNELIYIAQPQVNMCSLFSVNHCFNIKTIFPCIAMLVKCQFTLRWWPSWHTIFLINMHTILLCFVLLWFSSWVDSHVAFEHIRADSRFAPSQWEMTLLCNEVSHWLAQASNQSSMLFWACLTGTGAMKWLHQCKWSDPEGYG